MAHGTRIDRPADPVPLLLVLLFVRVVGSQLRRLLVLDLLWEDQVQEEGQKGGDGEAGLHDELDGVEEAEERVVAALVGEDVGEPAVKRVNMQIEEVACWSTYSETKVAPKPTDMAAVRIKRLRRVKGQVEIIRIPEIETAENKKVVIPPRTALGIETRAAANLLNIPITSNQKQQA